MNRRYCLTVDLKDDDQLIATYEALHKEVWPEIVKSIKSSGIEHMEIYRISNRLFMVIEVNEDFSFDRKAALDAEDEKVQEWETLMWKYQQALPGAKPGEKWMIMDRIFEL